MAYVGETLVGKRAQRFEYPFILLVFTKQCSQGQRQTVNSSSAATALIVAYYGAACVEIDALASAL
jgi:hypothetical protein